MMALMRIFVFLWTLNLARGFTCGTGCAPISLGGPIQPDIEEGLQCAKVATTGTCQTTTVNCNAAEGLQSILFLQLVGIPEPQFMDSALTPFISQFSCGTDGQWYYKLPDAQMVAVQAVYCGQACNPVEGPCIPKDALTPCPTPPTTTTTTTTLPPSTTCAPGGTWSAWTEPTACNDTCGSCGKSTKTRTCLSAPKCPCNGSSTVIMNCNIKPCPYPRLSCCDAYVAMVSEAKIICGPQPLDLIVGGDDSAPLTTTTTTTTAPCVSQWSEWVNGTCSDTCGMCGTLTRTRTCLTAATCPCSSSSVDTSQKCSNKPCPFPRPTCCTGFSRASVGGVFVCV